jgi:hypothetical protein
LSALLSFGCSLQALITVSCGGEPHGHQTRIVTGSLNSRFNEISVLSSKEDRLTLIVYDWDHLGKNKEVAWRKMNRPYRNYNRIRVWPFPSDPALSGRFFAHRAPFAPMMTTSDGPVIFTQHVSCAYK